MLASLLALLARELDREVISVRFEGRTRTVLYKVQFCIPETENNPQSSVEDASIVLTPKTVSPGPAGASDPDSTRRKARWTSGHVRFLGQNGFETALR